MLGVSVRGTEPCPAAAPAAKSSRARVGEGIDPRWSGKRWRPPPLAGSPRSPDVLRTRSRRLRSGAQGSIDRRSNHGADRVSGLREATPDAVVGVGLAALDLLGIPWRMQVMRSLTQSCMPSSRTRSTPCGGSGSPSSLPAGSKCGAATRRAATATCRLRGRIWHPRTPS